MKLSNLLFLGLLTCVALIGCNDEATQEVKEEVTTLELGNYFLVKTAELNCRDSNNNGEEVIDCEGEDGCFVIQITEERTSGITYYYADEGDLNFDIASYMITGDKIDFSFSAIGWGEWSGAITSSNKFIITVADEELGCQSTLEFEKQ